MVEREMACTRAELVAWLNGIGRDVSQRDRDTVSMAVDAGRVEVRMHEKPPRRIAALELPVLAVRMRFDAVDEAAQAAFLARFDLYTRRGGG